MLESIKLFGDTNPLTNRFINIGWILIIILPWLIMSQIGTTHLFPTPQQISHGFVQLFNEGLVTHVYSSLFLCGKAIVISILISLVFVYASPIPLLKPLSTFISKFRYLPLTGITFYMALMFKDAREVQAWVLISFMSTYLIMSLLSVLNDIKQEEFDHALSIGCTKLETLWQVIIIGRFDYVIDVIRQNLSIVWMMLVTVESISAASGGIGLLIKNSEKFSAQGRIVALQIVILIIGLSMDWIVNSFRKLAFRYSVFN